MAGYAAGPLTSRSDVRLLAFNKTTLRLGHGKGLGGAGTGADGKTIGTW